MIEKLTKENLKKYNYDDECIERLLTWDNHEHTLYNGLGEFFASNIEKKIYSGVDALRKIYFQLNTNPSFPYKDMSLVPEYYELSEIKFLQYQKKLAGTLFNEIEGKKKFLESERENIIATIKERKNNKTPLSERSSQKDLTQKMEWYLSWLNSKNDIVKEQISNQEHRSKILPIAIALTGMGKENLNYKTNKKVATSQIKIALSKHNITALEAINVLVDSYDAFSPDFEEKVVTRIKKFLMDEHELMQLATLTTKAKPTKARTLTMPQIAMIYAYEEKSILKGDKAKQIAAKYGFNAVNSGESLYQDYNRCKKSVDRKGADETKKKTKNKVELIKSVLENLTDNHKQKALDEIKILESIIENWTGT